MKFYLTKRVKQSRREKKSVAKILFLNQMLIFVRNMHKMSEIKNVQKYLIYCSITKKK